MYALTRPTPTAIARWRQVQASRPVFPTSGMIPDPPPNGFRANRGAGCVGHGSAVFEAAQKAVLNWEMFPVEWVQVNSGGEAVSLNQTVAVMARCFGIWTVNCCRVTHLDQSERRLVFIYATTDQHAIQGAEQFCVEHRPDDSVWFSIHAVSRPRDLAVWVALSKLIQLQHRFAREAPLALARAVQRRLIETTVGIQQTSNVETRGGRSM